MFKHAINSWHFNNGKVKSHYVLGLKGLIEFLKNMWSIVELNNWKNWLYNKISLQKDYYISRNVLINNFFNITCFPIGKIFFITNYNYWSILNMSIIDL
jgi:hypothetical protein